MLLIKKWVVLAVTFVEILCKICVLGNVFRGCLSAAQPQAHVAVIIACCPQQKGTLEMTTGNLVLPQQKGTLEMTTGNLVPRTLNRPVTESPCYGSSLPSQWSPKIAEVHLHEDKRQKKRLLLLGLMYQRQCPISAHQAVTASFDAGFGAEPECTHRQCNKAISDTAACIANNKLKYMYIGCTRKVYLVLHQTCLYPLHWNFGSNPHKC